MTPEPVLARAVWTERRDEHRRRLEPLVEPQLRRRREGRTHPVVDFLFTYYNLRPAELLRWHPGFGVVLADADEYATLRGYHRTPDGVTADPDYLGKRRGTVEFVADLLRRTAGRPMHLSCFGLHEWAMVYRTDDIRHGAVPLRLGQADTDTVVESMPLRCTHYDAFRFFTPAAVPRNTEPLTRADQLDREQPGCLHATMDLYKWCYKLGPLVDSGLTGDCFELAMAARALDMRASPYDLRSLGYEPVAVETPAGRAEYVRAQQDLATRAAELRARLLSTCDRLVIVG